MNGGSASINPSRTIIEVSYFQVDTLGPSDYTKLLFFRPGDGVRAGDWNFVPSPLLNSFWHAYRVNGHHAQVLTLLVQSPPPGFTIEASDPTARLFIDMMGIRPMERADSHFELFVGRSEDRERFYMRHVGPEGSLVPLIYTRKLADLMIEYGVGIEYPEEISAQFRAGSDWWVSYFSQVSQDEFQKAYDRLNLLHQLLMEASKRMYNVGFRYFRKALAEAEDSGRL